MSMRMTRRKFITAAGGAGVAATTGLLRLPGAATAAPATIRLLSHSSYNENSDKAVAKIGEAFAAQHNAAFAGEFIDQPEVAAKLTAEEQAQAGHDIVDLQDNLPTIHKNFLVPLDDVVAEIEKEFGAFYPVAKDSGYVDGHWLSLPWLGNAELAVYRSDYFAQAGEPIPSTWNDVLRAAPKLKKIGHPVGFAISQTEDSNAALYPLLWAFGAGVTDTTGRLAIDSPATNAALDFVRALAAQMDPAVYSWDDGGNNKDILSGHGSYTINAPSIYLRARREKMAFAAAIRQAQPPARTWRPIRPARTPGRRRPTRPSSSPTCSRARRRGRPTRTPSPSPSRRSRISDIRPNKPPGAGGRRSPGPPAEGVHAHHADPHAQGRRAADLPDARQRQRRRAGVRLDGAEPHPGAAGRRRAAAPRRGVPRDQAPHPQRDARRGHRPGRRGAQGRRRRDGDHGGRQPDRCPRRARSGAPLVVPPGAGDRAGAGGVPHRVARGAAPASRLRGAAPPPRRLPRAHRRRRGQPGVRGARAPAARRVLRHPAARRDAVRRAAAHARPGVDGARLLRPARPPHLGRPAGHGGEPAPRGGDSQHVVLRVPPRPAGVPERGLPADAEDAARRGQRDGAGAPGAGAGGGAPGLDLRVAQEAQGGGGRRWCCGRVPGGARPNSSAQSGTYNIRRSSVCRVSQVNGWPLD